MNNHRKPVIVGTGQYLQKETDLQQALEPLDLMIKTAYLAVEDAGCGPKLLKAVDYLGTPDVRSWKYGNLPSLLAHKLDIRPVVANMTYLGGNMSQWLVNQTARMIMDGECEAALLSGGESYYTVRRARLNNLTLDWSSEGPGETDRIGNNRLGFNNIEFKYNLATPTESYPLFENAWRANRGLTMTEHRTKMGKMLSRLTAVAADNPYARYPRCLTPEEITTATPENRMVGFPYTKRMCASLDVDKSSSLIMTSVSKARELGVPEDRWVYWLGGGDAEEDPWFVSERPNFHTCPAIRQSAEAALSEAGFAIQDIDYFDLYSCFHIAVQLACDELGLEENRPLTVTGGLPYAGQTGSGCGLDSIVSMVKKLQMDPEAKGMVTGNGWFLTKQSTGIYGAQPVERSTEKEMKDGSRPPREPVKVADDEAGGRGVIETYTVAHGRDGEPIRGLVIGRLEDGRRFIANTPEDKCLFDELEQEEGVGRVGWLSCHSGRHMFVPGQ